MAGEANEDSQPRVLGIEEALLALVVDAHLLDRLAPAGGHEPSAAHRSAGTLLLDEGQLRRLRTVLVSADPEGEPLRAAVASLGRAALADVPTFVVDKATPAPSGDAHDYVSLARYWWPDPSTTDGLPYVRRDGDTNPRCYSADFDADRLARFCDGVLALAVCGYLLDDDHLLAQARDRLLGWLVDPRTRQAPHFDYAQVVPGRTAVRAAAVIDARRMIAVAEAFRIVRAVGLLAADEERAVLAWFEGLLHWLTHSEAATQAAQARNNVAAWCLLERAVIADLVGDEGALSASLIAAGGLLETQVDSAGVLPGESVRANPADYTAFAFVAMALLAHVGAAHGVPLWSRRSGDGRGLSATRAWLAVSGSAPSPLAGSDPTLATALRLLAWRESAVDDAVARAERLADRLGRSEGEIARLEAHNEELRASAADASRDGLGVRMRRVPMLDSVAREAKRVVERNRPGRHRSRPPAAASPGASSGASPGAVHERAPGAAALEPATFVIYRILGNDLPPRHEVGQTIANTRFILEHEPPLAQCQKRWILNRIVDPAVERDLHGLLADAGQPVLRIPFRLDEYAEQALDLGPLAFAGPTTPRRGPTPGPSPAALAAAFRLKNLYAMNNNAARNLAIEDGRARATWVLPFDGGVFVTERAWEGLRAAVEDRPDLPYVVVPMSRALANTDVLAGQMPLPAGEEPQVGFRFDSGLRFEVQQPYGRRPKVELLWRLGVGGPWQDWRREPWDRPFPGPSQDHGRFQVAGSVIRLAAGSGVGPVTGTAGRSARVATRDAAIVDFLQAIDAQLSNREWASRDLAYYDEDVLEEMVSGRFEAGAAIIVAAARTVMLRAPGAVPPVGRARHWALFSDLAALGLAWRITRESGFAARGVDAVAAAVETGMITSAGSGLPGLHFGLDGLRLLRESGQIDDALADAFATALERALQSQELGVDEAIAAAAYLGQGRAFGDLTLRAGIQIASGEGAGVPTARHLLRLADAARVAGSGRRDLWHEPDGCVGALVRAIDRHLGRCEAACDVRTSGSDHGAVDAVLRAISRRTREPGCGVRDVAADPVTGSVPWVLPAEAGVAPFWPLGVGPQRVRKAGGASW